MYVFVGNRVSATGGVNVCAAAVSASHLLLR